MVSISIFSAAVLARRKSLSPSFNPARIAEISTFPFISSGIKMLLSINAFSSSTSPSFSLARIARRTFSLISSEVKTLVSINAFSASTLARRTFQSLSLSPARIAGRTFPFSSSGVKTLVSIIAFSATALAWRTSIFLYFSLARIASTPSKNNISRLNTSKDNSLCLPSSTGDETPRAPSAGAINGAPTGWLTTAVRL